MKFWGLIALAAASTLQLVSCQEVSMSPFVLHEVETTHRRLSKKEKLVKGEGSGKKGGGGGKKGGGGGGKKGGAVDRGDVCSDEDNFDSTLLVEFTGRPPTSQADMQALANAFVRTYNNLSERQCGEGVRAIQDAEFDPSITSGLTGRRLQPLSIPFPMVLRAKAVVCSPSSPSLFTSSHRRRNLIQEIVQSRRRIKGDKRGKKGGFGGKKGGFGGKKGAVGDFNGGAPSVACPPPSEDEFVAVYDEAVKGLDIATVDETIDSVVQVSELVEVPCDEEGSYEYLADVECELGDDLEDVTGSELSTLEQSYETSYNEVNALNPELCDPEFHVVTDVEIISYNRRRHGRELQRRGIFRHRVSGRNRGSSRSSGFNDGFRRAMEIAVEEQPSFLRELQTETCLCPRKAEFREPLIGEMVDQFDTNVKYLAARGKLKVCIGILGLTLIPPDASPDEEDGVSPGSPVSPSSKGPPSPGSKSPPSKPSPASKGF